MLDGSFRWVDNDMAPPRGELHTPHSTLKWRSEDGRNQLTLARIMPAPGSVDHENWRWLLIEGHLRGEASSPEEARRAAVLAVISYHLGIAQAALEAHIKGDVSTW